MNRNLTAIEKFSLEHDFLKIPAEQSVYEELIPKTTPGPGQQYAFAVDLDKCTGCKACVTACHSENGLDEDETWRSVGLIQGGTSDTPAIQHITTACHHCLDPACMDGCPTLAYTKDPATGIVKHLDDQCFGCQYCILKCPYDVPKYNKKRGIVHKCDMCISRLEVGQAPACVRACPSSAIRITLVDKMDVREKSQEYVRVPDAPASDYTFPTTRYTTRKNFPADMEAVDFYTVKPEHAHWPLVFMLILTQLSVGAFGAEFMLKLKVSPEIVKNFDVFHVFVAMGIGLLALAASLCHLGRPHLAFRAVLGFRKSWLSREIIAFGIFAPLAMVYALCHWFSLLKDFGAMSTGVLATGILGIFCSVMVYRDTRRPFWDNHQTTLKFFMTAIILGSATILLTATVCAVFAGEFLSSPIQYSGNKFTLTIMLTMIGKLFLESTVFLSLLESELSFFKKTAVLMIRPLKKFTCWRFACGIVGGILLPWMWMAVGFQMPVWGSVACVILMFGVLLAGELLERYLFFRAVVPLKMPGGKIL